MKKIWTSFVLCIMMSLSIFGLVACGEEVVPVESIVFEESTVEVFIGGTKQLKYDVYPENAKGFSLEWTSSNPKIATVNSKGKITAYNNYGEVTITVKELNSGITASCNVIVSDGNVYKITPNVAGMKTKYYQGEKFDPTGLVVYAYYQSGEMKELLPSEYTLSYPEVLTEDTKVIITYKDITSYINISVVEDVITGITVTTPPIKTTYFIGETFDPTGMKVSFVYASGKTKEIEGYSYDSSPLMYGSENIKITYEEYETYFTITIKANTIINNIAKLQSEINNAEIGSSIMIANGTFNISSPILIPKSKNLTIFGESQDVTITSSGNALFMLVNDVDDSSTHNTIIANMTLKSNNQNNSIISIDNDTSINNLNNINITLLKINFEVPTNGNAINLSSKTDGFEQTQLEKVNLTLNQCNIYNNGSSEVNDNNTIIINGINESEINIKDCTLISKCNLINIENGNNITLNIENSFLESNVCSLNFENVLGGEIIVTKQSYIKGFPAINMTNCSDLEVTIETSYLTVYQQSEDLEENKSSVILLTGCQNINISSKDTTLNTLYKNDEDYINAICYIILIQDGTTLSSNNNISLTDCNIITTNEIKFLNLEKEPTSVINQYTTEE